MDDRATADDRAALDRVAAEWAAAKGLQFEGSEAGSYRDVDKSRVAFRFSGPGEFGDSLIPTYLPAGVRRGRGAYAEMLRACLDYQWADMMNEITLTDPDFARRFGAALERGHEAGALISCYDIPGGTVRVRHCVGGAEIPLATDPGSTALARGAAVLSGGPAAGVEISLGTTLPFHLLATVAPDFLEVVAANVGDLRAGRACYDRTERRDARGFAVYEWDGVAAARPAEPTGPAKVETAEPGSWLSRPALF